MTYAVDMLTPSINPAAIKAAGFMGVLRYLRNLTALEVVGYLSAGLGVGTIFETQANRSLGGAPAGNADAITATQQAVALGQPAGTLMVVNLADFAPAPADIPAIEAYWVAFVATSPFRCCGYGTGYVIDQLTKRGLQGLWWQNAMDDGGWPGTQLHPQASLYQDTLATLPVISGTRPSDYDQDVVIAPLPWWTSDPTPGGDMPLTPTDIAAETASNMHALRVLFSPGDPSTTPPTPEGELYGRVRETVEASITAMLPTIVNAVVAAIHPAPAP